jgi:hypothetical protein
MNRSARSDRALRQVAGEIVQRTHRALDVAKRAAVTRWDGQGLKRPVREDRARNPAILGIKSSFAAKDDFQTSLPPVAGTMLASIFKSARLDVRFWLRTLGRPSDDAVE